MQCGRWAQRQRLPGGANPPIFAQLEITSVQFQPSLPTPHFTKNAANSVACACHHPALLSESCLIVWLFFVVAQNVSECFSTSRWEHWESSRRMLNRTRSSARNCWECHIHSSALLANKDGIHSISTIEETIRSWSYFMCSNI